MAEPKVEIDKTDPPAKAKTKQKKPRGVSVKNPVLFLYIEKENGDLSPIDYLADGLDICQAYANALDAGTPQKQLLIFKGRFVRATVAEKKRRITIS